MESHHGSIAPLDKGEAPSSRTEPPHPRRCRFGQIPRRRLAQHFLEHRDEGADRLIAKVLGDALHAYAGIQPLQRYEDPELLAPPSEAHAGFTHDQHE